MDLKQYQRECLEAVDRALDHFLPGEDVLPVNLHKAMRYSVFAGGKRIRPVLMIAACEAAGGERETVLPAACAMEMIHTYSLIHDDLPAMDDDDFRRGKPTNHRVFGEALAILAGDGLLTEAFRLLADPDAGARLAPVTRLRILELMARSAGSFGMVAGQVVDMESEGRAIDFPTLEFIHTRKTGALILAAIQTGALVAGADEETFASLSRYGEAAGLAFQVADDILDIVGDQAQLGKDVGSDQQRGKATYPALLGLEEARQKAVELRDLALAALQPFGEEAEPLRQIARYIVDRSV
ncbi:polyprenyl synthetase family protein [Geothermobacter hydrogeniphilus]|uniref:Polyprenyl synthetase n=1 Tax=Geothermobacter hydrogeniphilus TaxID=1969733 RepID=A0A1X0YCJ3_9BACT|nr:farnesyl diphosphate synthase [Geothermobacter hydrogeniphilus]ORJ62895.1 polyprenyl synthetase [Geothermobacter hydrogeniphilus]